MQKSKDLFNIFNINAILLEPECASFELIKGGFKNNHTGMFFCVLKSLFIMMHAMVLSIFTTPLKYKFASISSSRHLYDGKILFFLPSLNNRRSLADVIEKVKSQKDNVVVIGEGGLRSTCCPWLRMLFVSLIHLPYFWREYRKYSPQQKRILIAFMYTYITTPGVTWFFRKMLKKYKPECVVLANDHSLEPKSLELACEENGVQCVYVQHASVSHAFPELHFSQSFLDGLDALEKYSSKGKQQSGKIVLLGAVRYDQLSKYRVERNDKKRNCIGLAINEIDNNQICNEICNDLLRHFPEKTIKVRMHPAMKNRPFTFDNKERIIYTCATDETIIDYLDSIDVQISNDSGVHLDAILGGVRTIAYKLSTYEFGDNYGYMKDGLIHLAENVEQLVKFVSDESYLSLEIDKVRKFDESYGKSYSGDSSNIVADFLLSEYNFNYLIDKYIMEKRQKDSFDYYVIPQ